MNREERDRELLAPHLSRLGQWIMGGWQDFAEMVAGHAPSIGLTPRSRANDVYDYIVQRARAGCVGLPDVTPVERTTFYLNVSDRVLVKFNKLDHQLHPSENFTQPTLDFGSQTMAFPGMDAPSNVTAGYVLDRAQISITRMVAACRVDGFPIWEMSIPMPRAGEAGDSGTTPVRPVRPIEPMAPAAGTRISSTLPDDEEATGEDNPDR